MAISHRLPMAGRALPCGIVAALCWLPGFAFGIVAGGLLRGFSGRCARGGSLSPSQTKFKRDLLLFIIGKTYTREQINAALGGSTQACIPTLNGLVLAVCVTPELNPRAPSELLCGVGPIMARTGAMLAAASYKVPFFIKRRVNKWEYMGLYRSVDSHASGARLNEMVNGSGRSPNDVSLAIDLHP